MDPYQAYPEKKILTKHCNMMNRSWKRDIMSLILHHDRSVIIVHYPVLDDSKVPLHMDLGCSVP